MIFNPVPPKLNISHLEDHILIFWKTSEVFHKSIVLRDGSKDYIFYEMPLTANDLPRVINVMARFYRDMFLRYKAMCGYHVVRRVGWQTHGLAVEYEIEKKLGITSKSQLEEYGVEKFNEQCRHSVFTYIQEWEVLSERMAYWVDMSTAFVTYTNEYIESVWWILKQLWEKKQFYQAKKVVPYCPRCQTSFSNQDAVEGARLVDASSIFVRFPLVDDSSTSFLVWTSNPWTLPGNVALGVYPNLEYVTVERELPEGGSERLILARSQLEALFIGEDFEVVDSFKGRKLAWKRYQPLFTFILPDTPAYSIILHNTATSIDGTGFININPELCAAAMDAARKYDLPILKTIKSDGTFTPEVRPWMGMFFREADPIIVQDLHARGLLFKSETITHTYPHCYCCHTPLLNYAQDTWFIRTSEHKDRLLELNEKINWFPEHVKSERFGKWLQTNVDWNVGRDRYWGTPIPVWKCKHCNHQICIGSVEELTELTEADVHDLDLHLPDLDDIKIPCQKCGEQMVRVTGLIDVWFEAGAMPTAQWHYPFENQEDFKTHYPADLICEILEQSRSWLFSLHAISSLLFEQPCFKHVICLGSILDEHGRKMSISNNNDINPWDVINVHGTDAFRWYLYTASHPEQDRLFSVDLVGEVVRKFSDPLWEIYEYLVTNANQEEWSPSPVFSPFWKAGGEGDCDILNRWLISELHILISQVTSSYERYDVLGATIPIQEFVQLISNWYLRWTRQEKWKGKSPENESDHYDTLFLILVTLSKLLAPTMPLMAEELYQNLVRSQDSFAHQSVHLSEWPQCDETQIDENLNQEITKVIKLISLGRTARQRANLLASQPVGELAFTIGTTEESDSLLRYTGLIKKDLTVKRVSLLEYTEERFSVQINPLTKKISHKFGDQFQEVEDALLALDPCEVANRLAWVGKLFVDIDDETFEILPDEVDVQINEKSGFAFASEGKMMVTFSTDLTQDLIIEGLVSEFIQQMITFRDQENMGVADLIRVFYIATPELDEAISIFKELIMEQIFAHELVVAEPIEGMVTVTVKFNHHWAAIGMDKYIEGKFHAATD